MVAERRPGWWYPYIFVAGFMLVLLVNLTMAYFATSTFSGLATESPYEKGLAYNSSIADARRQDSLGWTADARMEPGEGHALNLVVGYKDRDGKPVDGLSVTADIVRPTAKGHDRHVVLGRTAPGVYATSQQLPFPGQWEVAVVAKGEGGVIYGLDRRYLAP